MLLLLISVSTISFSLVSGNKLRSAVGEGSIVKVEEILKNDFNAVNDADEIGHTCLHLALETKREKIAEKLVENGADVNAYRSSDGVRPLHLAIREDLISSVRLLLKWKADAGACDKNLDSPLHYAIRSSHKAIFVRLLMLEKVPLNGCNCQRFTPLIMAVVWKSESAVQELLEAGAEVNAMDDFRNTALHHATPGWKTVIFNALLKKGANPNLGNKKGVTSLHIAVESGTETKIRQLLAFGACINNARNDGCTVLHIAVMKGLKKNEVDLLVSKGADPDVRNIENKLPIDLALECGNKGVVGALIEGGANLTPEWAESFLMEFVYKSRKNSQLRVKRGFLRSGAPFEDYALHASVNYLECKGLNAVPGRLAKMMRLYLENEVFAVYRVLKAYNADFDVELESSMVESRKVELFVEILRNFVDRTHLAALSVEIASTVIRTAGYYGWVIEKVAWNLALASYMLNVNTKDVKSLLSYWIKDNNDLVREEEGTQFEFEDVGEFPTATSASANIAEGIAYMVTSVVNDCSFGNLRAI